MTIVGVIKRCLIRFPTLLLVIIGELLVMID